MKLKIIFFILLFIEGSLSLTKKTNIRKIKKIKIIPNYKEQFDNNYNLFIPFAVFILILTLLSVIAIIVLLFSSIFEKKESHETVSDLLRIQNILKVTNIV
jgi:hypothetical protein